MKHLSWRYRRRRTRQEEQEFRDAQSRRAHARWEKHRARQIETPVRQSKLVELTIRDSHRPMRVIRLRADPTDRGWGRFAGEENGRAIAHGRRFGHRHIATLIAQSLR